MRKLRDISYALLMVLYMSHVGDSRLFVPDWDRGLEDCPVPSFENVKVSREVSIEKHITNARLFGKCRKVKLRSGGRFAIYKCKNKRRFVQIEGPTMSLCLRGR